jgi:hypothetical protein
MRIALRRQAIDRENKEIALVKEEGVSHVAHVLENRYTLRQLFIRSRYLLFKNGDKWTPKQRSRAEVLFKYYPQREAGYKLTVQLKGIYHTTRDRNIALTGLAGWYEAAEQTGFQHFNTAKTSIAAHCQIIINFFDNRSINASAESFNAKIKAFRSVLRGVKHIPYFLFRLTKIYA